MNLLIQLIFLSIIYSLNSIKVNVQAESVSSFNSLVDHQWRNSCDISLSSHFASGHIHRINRTIKTNFRMYDEKQIHLNAVIDIIEEPSSESLLAELIITRLNKMVNTMVWFANEELYSPNDIVEYLKSLVYHIDEEVCDRLHMKGGAALSLVLRINDFAYIMSIGDSKTVVYKKGAYFMETRTHTLHDHNELNRIIERGGYVTGGKVMGRSPVTRSIGYCDLKTIKNWRDGDELYHAKNGTITAMPNIEVVWLEPEVRYTFVSATHAVFEAYKNSLPDVLGKMIMGRFRIDGDGTCAKISDKAVEVQALKRKWLRNLPREISAVVTSFSTEAKNIY